MAAGLFPDKHSDVQRILKAVERVTTQGSTSKGERGA